ncbi:hypothetical protein [Nocardioides bizhenqiangii]|uniref:Uncharacterized protein n=1 Tax=Nocardioides bizhenqiangii TaxID=3095076 RepID=A0ABZ0ZM17_9ACTN|nr:hypothetical protein [Nocardioides sp. HM61]WQQ25362.1 hypothetical protein SHK19_15495 [Nocardioides sp. HM61]
MLVGIVIGLILVASFLYSAPPSDDPNASTSSTGSSVSTSTVDIGADGGVHVVTDLHFAAPVDRLTLRVPEGSWSGGEFDPVVDGIELDIAGDQMAHEETLTTGDRTSVALPSGTVEVLLEYDATGTFVASTPSTAGRGLVLLNPLEVKARDSLSQVEVLDDRVLNLGCVGTGELSACATRDGRTWIATPVADADQVIAQVDLLGGSQDAETDSNR